MKHELVKGNTNLGSVSNARFRRNPILGLRVRELFGPNDMVMFFATGVQPP